MARLNKETPSRTLFEKYSDDEIVGRYGEGGWLIAFVKSLSTHDSDKHRRRREKTERRNRRKK